MNDSKSQLHDAIVALTPQMKSLLGESLCIPSISGDELNFVRFIRDFAAASNFTTDLWETNEADLIAHPVGRARHIPLAGRPTLVVGLSDPGKGRSLIFNAHSDVVSPGRLENWTFGPWSGAEHTGRFYGRGACDVKGPLISALWAMLALQKVCPNGLPVRLELVPGEEDCVTLGTLTSVIRGYKADACIVLEPTECLPRNASRPGVRFDIVCSGKAVHGTVKWLGEDAISLAHAVIAALNHLETEWNDRTADPLFECYPIARPITVDTIHGGEWQGMICDQCQVAGYLELLPNDEPGVWMQRLTTELRRLLDLEGLNSRRVDVKYPEQYQGHATKSDISLCITADEVLESSAALLQNESLTWTGWSGFNSGCEAGLRADLHKTPTLVWGPGSLAQAHAADEFVDFHQVEITAELFARFAHAWAGSI